MHAQIGYLKKKKNKLNFLKVVIKLKIEQDENPVKTQPGSEFGLQAAGL